MQEAMLYANWPINVLRYDKFKIERDVQGKLLFRGPRWEVGGICKGFNLVLIPVWLLGVV